MTALLLATLLGVQVGSHGPADLFDGSDRYSPSAGPIEGHDGPGVMISYPGWLSDFGAERSSVSILPSWISGILDSPVLHTPMRVRISRSGFTLGWRLSFDL